MSLAFRWRCTRTAMCPGDDGCGTTGWIFMKSNIFELWSPNMHIFLTFLSQYVEICFIFRIILNHFLVNLMSYFKLNYIWWKNCPFFLLISFCLCWVLSNIHKMQFVRIEKQFLHGSSIYLKNLLMGNICKWSWFLSLGFLFESFWNLSTFWLPWFIPCCQVW